MAHQVNDIVEVQWRSAYEESVIMNVYHLRVISSSSSSSDVADNQSLADHLAGVNGVGAHVGPFRNALPTNVVLQRVRTQKIAPNRSPYTEATIGQFGLWPALASTGNLAGVITKRGSLGTRKSVGSLHVGPLPDDAKINGMISAGYLPVLDNLYDALSAVFTAAVSLVTYQMVIYNRTSIPNWNQIAAHSVQDTVRVMRRRTLRVGI